MAAPASSSAAPHPVSSTSTPGPPEATPKQKGEGKQKKSKNVDAAAAGVAAMQIAPEAPFLKPRNAMFDRLFAEQQAHIAKQPREPIKVSLPNDTSVDATSYETSPLDIAKQLSKSLAKKVVIAKVDDVLWDLERPLEKSCSLRLLDFDDPEGKRVFWHSSAHVLGEAAEQVYGCHLCLGPPTDEGFFYEMGIPGERNHVLLTDFPTIEQHAVKATKEKQKFERLVVKKEDLLEMFHYNKYKQYLINSKIPDGESTTVYRCGPMIDLCVGPHIPDTGRIEAMKVVKASSSYFLGDRNNESLQRIYGISFPDKQRMKEHEKFVQEAAERDHRKIGKEQELFFFNDISPGSCFWLPHGTRIYNTLVEMIKAEYHKRGFTEVITPNMYNVNLWKQSGHWQNYAENMFKVTVEKEDFALKPMNCPGHCVIFNSRDRSYRELPLRLADFGVLHRNEASGALTGLTRVRRFQQDDAHIFCTTEQIEDEMAGCFDFMQHVYGLFGFSFKLELSTRPDKRLGDDETWDRAEKALENSLNKFRPGQWELNEGDGAFYGPKIDISIQDALRRSYQCATIQLDFQLPQKFDLRYRTESGAADPNAALKQPVMIHRAVLGSVERFTAIIIEHFGGKWPFWLSPRQVLVIPVNTATHGAYAEEVAKTLWDAGIYAEADLSSAMLNKRIRTAELSQANFILVVGGDEMDQRTVNIRNRDDVGTKKKGKMLPLTEVVEAMVRLKRERRLQNSLGLEDEAPAAAAAGRSEGEPAAAA